MRIATTDLPHRRDRPPRPARPRAGAARIRRALPPRAHPHPGQPRHPAPDGRHLPREYGRTLDPFVALGQAAAVTERLGLGTGITPGRPARPDRPREADRDPRPPLRRPPHPRHRLRLERRGGRRPRRRLAYPPGAGPRPDGADARPVGGGADGVRGRVRVASGRAPRTPSRCRSAAPATAPGPRTLIGGAAGPKLFAHIAEYADGWLPIGGGGLAEALPVLRPVWADARARPGGAAGGAVRGPASARQAGALRRARHRGGRRAAASGGGGEVLGLLDEYGVFLGGA